MNLWQRFRDNSFDLFHVASKEEVDRLLGIQLKIASVIVAAVALAELAVFFFARDTGTLGTSALDYLLRYLVVPSGLNLLLLCVSWRAHRKRRNAYFRTYVNCSAFVDFTFVLYATHMQFDALMMCFGLPIMMTIVFGEMMLTSCVYFLSLLSKIIADWFLVMLPPFRMYRVSSPMDWVNFLVSLAVMTCIYAITMVAIGIEHYKHKSVQSKELERRSLYEESITDPVTGVFNRKALQRSFNRLAAGEVGESCMLVMMDMDRFKQLNDGYGHQAGDQLLRQFARLLKQVPNAEAYRYGGDEFCLLLRGYSRQGAMECCRELQIRLRASDIGRRAAFTTVSFGVAEYEKGMAPAELVRRADQALYQAKGRRDHSVFYEASRSCRSPDRNSAIFRRTVKFGFFSAIAAADPCNFVAMRV